MVDNPRSPRISPRIPDNPNEPLRNREPPFGSILSKPYLHTVEEVEAAAIKGKQSGNPAIVDLANKALTARYAIEAAKASGDPTLIYRAMDAVKVVPTDVEVPYAPPKTGDAT